MPVPPVLSTTLLKSVAVKKAREPEPAVDLVKVQVWTGYNFVLKQDMGGG